MKKMLAVAVMLAFVPAAMATLTVLDDFEVDEGHFAVQPTFSGSTSGLLTDSTADRIETEAYQGIASQQLVLVDNPATTNWSLRHLSGVGAIGNNVPIQPVGWIGYALKTTTPDLMASFYIDDGSTGGTEQAVPVAIIADGEWHVYQWDMADESYWNPWVGVSNGALDSATVTIDAIKLTSSVDQDATVFIDSVMYNNEGIVPEPATLALLALGGLAIVRRR